MIIPGIKKFAIERLHVPVLLFLLVWTVFPLFWALSASFKTYVEIYRTPPSIFPDAFHFNNYLAVFRNTNFWVFFANSAFLTIVSTTIVIIISLVAAYAFSRYSFRFASFIIGMLLLVRIVPTVSLVIPIFIMMASVGLLNTYTALFISYIATSASLCTWIILGYLKTMPIELEEAAIIEGARKWQILVFIIVPIAAPALITATVFSLRQAWNEFPFVLSLTSSTSMRTLPYQLFLLKDTMGIEDWPVVMAFNIMAIMPLLIFYFFIARKVISGIMSGALK